MPEIKHSFHHGKMNKDLDERLVPNGQYRDALNIEVSTSDGSNVGAVENILGNAYVDSSCNIIPEGSTCVGSISDEKNDSVYWLSAGPNIRAPYYRDGIPDIRSGLISSGYDTSKDMIVQHKNGECVPVLVDIHKLIIATGSGTDYDTNNTFSTNTTSAITLENLDNIGIGMTVTGLMDTGTDITTRFSTTVLGFDEFLLENVQFTTDYTTTYTTPGTFPNLQNPFGAEIVGTSLPGSGSNWAPTDVLSIPNISTNVNVGDEVTGTGIPTGTTIQSFTTTSTHTNFILSSIPSITGSYPWFISDVEFYYPGASYPIATLSSTITLNLSANSLGITVGMEINSPQISQYPVFVGTINGNKIILVDYQGNEVIPSGGAGYMDVSGTSGIPNQITLPESDTVGLVGQYPPVDYLVFERERVLNFDNNKLITGINIIDDLLFWTDNHTEPKKINIERSIEGTIDENHHTNLIVEHNVIEPIKEDHITVIRKSPKSAPDLKMESTERNGLVNCEFFGNWLANPEANPNTQVNAGPDDPPREINLLTNPSDGLLNYMVGDQLLFLEFASVGTLPEQSDITVIITEVKETAQITIGGVSYLAQKFEVEILSIASHTVVGNSDYNVTLKNTEQNIFPTKFPRFGTRWKYEDGEYSTFSPFSHIAFLPGKFKYPAKDPTNYGMKNHIKSLQVQNFIPHDIPVDVTEVEILYKDENTPAIYLVDTFKQDDPLKPNSDTNSWNSTPEDALPNSKNKGVYNVRADVLYAMLPENQLLRLWDNVPKKALAQEIVGNRIVYGNYLQNLDLKSFNEFGELSNIKTFINATYKRRIPPNLVNTGQKSIKSLRTYQVGIVYGDRYGRETPILTDSLSSFIVPKIESSNSNLISVKIQSDAPEWADYYKTYIKEISEDYYNLVLDRVYLAEDGNLWLSFPSSERNKLQEDDFIILKKKADSNNQVEREGRYKVVAIENEVPDFIKQKQKTLGSAYAWTDPNNTGTNTMNLFTVDKEPRANKETFTLISDAATAGDWTDQGGASNLVDMGNVLMVQFGKVVNGTDALKSDKYFINNVEEGNDILNITLDKPIKAKDKWVGTQIGANYIVEDTLTVQIFEVETEIAPEYLGRFFVKIPADDVSDDNLLTQIGITNTYNIVAAKDMYSLLDGENTNLSVVNYGTTSDGAQNADEKSSSISDWEYNLQFGSDNLTSGWFIDGAYYQGETDHGTAGGVYPEIGYMGLDEWESVVSGFSGVKDIFGSQFDVWDGDLFYTSGGTDGYTTTYHKEGYGRGIWEETDQYNNTRYYMEISYSGINPDLHCGWDCTNVLGEVYETYIWTDTIDLLQNVDYAWGVGVTANSYNQEEEDFTSEIKNNARFQIGGDAGTIYKILDIVGIKRRLNHTTFDTVMKKYADWKYPCGNAASSAACNLALRDIADVGLKNIGRSDNRRLTYILELDKNPLVNPTHNFFSTSGGVYDQANIETPIEISFVSSEYSEEIQIASENPAVFETEVKEEVDLNIFYENNKTHVLKLSGNNGHDYAPLGSELRFNAGGPSLSIPTVITAWGNNQVLLNQFLPFDENEPWLVVGEKIRLVHPGRTYSTVTVKEIFTVPSSGEIYKLAFEEDVSKEELGLEWHNCYTFFNGVESNRIEDSFNKQSITNGVRVSTPMEEPYLEERRKYGLIYSGLYNSTSGVNNLNQFIMAEKITKDIDPTHGSIQKLFARNTDLVTFCEDKVLKILANKSAIYDAEGNPQLTATEKVLGQTIPFVGDYGISKDPQSFAKESYRAYFTDRQRGAVLRLSMDGLTPISNYGMTDWFKDNLRLGEMIVGSYDDKKDDYNLTIHNEDITKSKTVTFSEDVKGWVSFKSFLPESGLSCAGEYFTFYNGEIWRHYSNINCNIFYNIGPYESNVSVILNEQPDTIKSFKTLAYEGSQSNIDQFTNQTLNNVNYSDESYYNLVPKQGWYVESIITDQQEGTLNEFIEKEGKWFNYIKGVTTNLSNIDPEELSFQGIGMANITTIGVWGCMTPGMFNYDPAVTIDDGSCYSILYGCMDPAADNYYPGANTPDGSCIFLGCTDNTMFNYDPLATFNDGCVPFIYGCTTLGQLNYDPAANTDDGSCIEIIEGCTDPTACDYNPLANNIISLQCCYTSGCTDPLAFNYNNLACCDDGSCCYDAGCTDPIALNYNAGYCFDDGSCTYPGGPSAVGCMDSLACNFEPLAVIQPLNACDYSCWGCVDNSTFTTSGPYGGTWNTYTNYDPNATSDCVGTPGGLDTSCCIPTVPGCTDDTAFNYNSNANIDDGSCYPVIVGCTDLQASNYITPIGDNFVDVNTACNGTNGGPAICPVPGFNCCCTVSIYGCTDDTLYDVGAPISSWIGQYMYNYNPLANVSISCIQQIYGCMDVTSCQYINHGGPGPLPGVNAQNANEPCCTNCGCTDSTMFNYDATACWNCNDTNGTINGTSGGCCEPIVMGCIDPLALNAGMPSGANTDDGSCCYIAGCMDSTAINFDPTACIQPPNVVCIPTVLGCMDNTTPAGTGLNVNGITNGACNYNPNANVDDGSCTYANGCTDTNALNYGACAPAGCTYQDCYGCLDPTVGTNPDVSGNCQDGTTCSGTGCCGSNNGWSAMNYYEACDANSNPGSGVPLNPGTCGGLITGCCQYPQSYTLKLNEIPMVANPSSHGNLNNFWYLVNQNLSNLWSAMGNWQMILGPNGKQVPEGTNIQLTYVVDIYSANTYPVQLGGTGASPEAWYNMTACSLKINGVFQSNQGTPPLPAPYAGIWVQNPSPNPLSITNPTQNYIYPSNTVFGANSAYVTAVSEEIYNTTPVAGLQPSFPDLIRVTFTIDMVMPSNDVTIDFNPSFDPTANGWLSF